MGRQIFWVQIKSISIDIKKNTKIKCILNLEGNLKMILKLKALLTSVFQCARIVGIYGCENIK